MEKKNTKKYKCPCCSKLYSNLDELYECAKKDEAENMKKEEEKSRIEEERKTAISDIQSAAKEINSMTDKLKDKVKEYNKKYPNNKIIYEINTNVKESKEYTDLHTIDSMFNWTPYDYFDDDDVPF